MMIHKRRIVADEEIINTPAVADEGAEGTVDVAPEATDLLFEAEDVAELIADVTGEAVEVEIADEEDTVTFTVGEDEFVVEAEGTEEILESVRKNVRGKKAVTASTKKRAGRVIKKLPSKK